MNKLTMLCALLSACALPAQGGPVKARLLADTKVASAGGQAMLTLEVDVATPTALDATILRGTHLSVQAEGAAAKAVGSKVPGQVKVAGGTEIRRHLVVQMPPGLGADGLARVTVSWPGLEGASVSIQVAPDQNVDLDRLDYAKTRVMLVTNYGNMTLKFFPDKAPNHVRNFVELSASGFYNGTKFHRIIRGFMIQGGCPNTKDGATGRPGTGERPDGKRLKAEFNDIKHQRGILSMARGRDPNSASCQFFICHGSAPSLDGKYTAFGELVDGDDTLEKIATVPVSRVGGEMSHPIHPVRLFNAIVLPVYKDAKD